MTVTLERTNLRAVVAAVIAESGAVEPGEIAAKVATQIPEAELRDILAVALRPYVREWIGQQRMILHAARPKDAPTASSRVAAVRDHWQQICALQVSVAGAWKSLGECTSEDIMKIADVLRDNAARSAAKAAKYEAVAAEMERRRVSHARELPQSVLVGLLQTQDES